jgi:hypothetical protein
MIDLMHLQLSLVADAENRPLYHLYCLADYSRTLEYHTRLHWPLRIQPRLSPAAIRKERAKATIPGYGMPKRAMYSIWNMKKGFRFMNGS